MSRFRPSYLALGLVTLLGACAGAGAEDRPPATDQSALVDRGRYLTVVGACHDCHTPKMMTAQGPEPDMTRAFMGHPAEVPVGDAPAAAKDTWVASTNGDLTAWSGPWGVSFTANLTPSRSGLMGWTPEMFIATIRKGRHAGVGRPLLPPMPWANYAHMTDDDLRAIFAYLQTVKPIDNQVPAPRPPAATPGQAQAGEPAGKAG